MKRKITVAFKPEATDPHHRDIEVEIHQPGLCNVTRLRMDEALLLAHRIIELNMKITNPV